jgi:hypothetical protein
MNQNILLLFSISLLFVMIVPAYAQTDSNSVVINEVDLNPIGNDAYSSVEWIELYNPTDEDVDLSGWQIASTTVLKKTMTISDGTIIQPGQFKFFNYHKIWFTDSNDSIELKDSSGIVIDKTPTFSDTLNNYISWQRLYDGYDSDSSDDWKFILATPNSSNGIIEELEKFVGTTITVSSDKSSYVFDEVAIIEGNVSEKLFVMKPTYTPEAITITISGNLFEKSVTLYPDMSLDFKLTQNLQQVLGIIGGDYLVSVKYGDSVSQTTFSVGDEIIPEQIENAQQFMVISTDKSEYLPGSNVKIILTPDFIIPLESLHLKIYDPNELEISSGNLFPIDGVFSTSVFLNTINPQYGTYKIISKYSDYSAIFTFDLIEDIKEKQLISLWTDKEVYGLGDTVSISGRLNNFWIPSMDIEIRQMRNLALDGGGISNEKIDSIILEGDSSFTYSYKIPRESGLGDYVITISDDIGSAIKSFVVVTNPDEYIFSDAPFVAFSDNESYDAGDTLFLTGKIAKPVLKSTFDVHIVKLTISDSLGQTIQIPVGIGGAGGIGGQIQTSIDDQYTIIPDDSGRFSLELPLVRSNFPSGSYDLNLTYGSLVTSVPFSVIDTSVSEMVLTIDKDVYGLGESVNLSGFMPPRGTPIVYISVTEPDRNVSTFNVQYTDDKFTWSWKIPSVEKTFVKNPYDSMFTPTNFGIYKIGVGTSPSSITESLFFKVSLDPENDSISKSPLYLATEKVFYKPGDKVKIIGNILDSSFGNSEGQFTTSSQRISLQIIDHVFPYPVIFESKVYPAQNGEFVSYAKLVNLVFTPGEFTVRAAYNQLTAESTFVVVDDSVSLDDSVSVVDDFEKPQISKSSTVIEKENRITKKLISISTEEKSSDDAVISPRVISGSLVTPSRADESNVNLRVSTESGICIIGTDAECLVHDSTRKPGQIYDVVEVDGLSLNVRYSGPDVRLEKFSILPVSSSEFLPDTNWNIDVIKDDQLSRFYYKVTYKTLE